MNEARQQRIEAYYENKIPHVEFMMDNVWDPHNVAAVSRTADGLGIRCIHLYYTYNEFPPVNRVGKKTSSSANQWIEFNKVKDLSSFVEVKKAEGYRFIGAGIGKTACQLTEYQFPEKCIVIMGSESTGMSSEIQEICDDLVYIPMVGMVTSFNISVAAAIMMYEIYKQKGASLRVKSIDEFQNNHNRGRNPKSDD